ncbi:MAG TPA: M15 family metallopeptidase [Alphaproteobacteria bacterium]|nr:M15 family metallopeptidase [Alphaproteobacteria bacterium]
MSDIIAIAADDLLPLEDFTNSHPLRVDLVYAQEKHPDNMFGCAIYRADARMLCHRKFLPIILDAALLCHAQSGLSFELKDCLRTVEAQEMMRQTDIVKANPHWLEEPNRLLSPPGKGGHPRGMAIDIILLDANGDEVDMGTRFDYLTPDPARNPAARSFRDLPADVLARRQLLEECMMQSAAKHELPLLPLPQEWWDFRFPRDLYDLYAPVQDVQMPPACRMTAA